MANTNKFSSIQIGLASPEKIREWSYGEVKNLKRLTIVLKSLKKMVYFVKESLDHLRIGNVVVENIRKLDIKVLYVIDVV